MSDPHHDDDPYQDRSTGVLHNLIGITDPSRLARAEAELTFARAIGLSVSSLPGNYDLDHLCAFHRMLFGDIYEWAGKLRTVRIAKTDPFCLPQFIESAAKPVFQGITDDRYLSDLARSDFVERLATHLGDVNALHPFRGNGRAQRAFFGQLACDAGWRIEWSRLDPAQNDEASQASLVGDPGPLRQLIDELVTG